MDAVLDGADTGSELKAFGSTDDHAAPQNPSQYRSDKPTEAEAQEAVRTLLRWAGDNPNREGLLDTPKRVTKAYREFFAGYEQDPVEMLNRTFEEVEGYDDMVLLRGVKVQSHCEHHMVPIEGTAHVAYIPDGKVVGISKLARVVEAFSRRLQTQETMTAQIADTIENVLQPKGLAIVVDATHGCMTSRGVKHDGVFTLTRQFRGVFKEERLERQFWDMVRNPHA